MSPLTTIRYLLWLADSIPLLIFDNFQVIDFSPSQLNFDILVTIFLALSLLPNHNFVFHWFDPLVVNIPLLEPFLILIHAVQCQCMEGRD